jgi:hypothetical protein
MPETLEWLVLCLSGCILAAVAMKGGHDGR